MNLQDEINKAKELLNQLEDKQAKELLKPKSKRVLSEDENGYALNSLGDAFNCNNTDLATLASNDNAFIDKESAQLQAQRNKLVHKMRLAAADCPVDWSDNQASKYYVIWDFDDSSRYVRSSGYNRHSQLPHFSNCSKLEMFMSTLSPQEQKLLVAGVE